MRLGDIVAMVTLAIIIVVAVLLIANFQAAISTLNLSPQQQQIVETTIGNLYTGLQLAGIGIIVLAAVGIIVLILGAFGGLAAGRP